MTVWGYINLFLTLMIGAAALGAAVYAFNYPTVIEPAANAAIASLSIVFGLSTAISSLASMNPSELSYLSRDQSVKGMQIATIIRDNQRTISRQKALNWSALTSVCLGLVYLVSVYVCVECLLAKIVAAAFTGLSFATLLFAFFLPALLSALIKRNSNWDKVK